LPSFRTPTTVSRLKTAAALTGTSTDQLADGVTVTPFTLRLWNRAACTSRPWTVTVAAFTKVP
jgi:hypothetical protein